MDGAGREVLVESRLLDRADRVHQWTVMMMIAIGAEAKSINLPWRIVT